MTDDLILSYAVTTSPDSRYNDRRWNVASPISGATAARFAGQWNRKRVTRAAYLALDRAAAFLEPEEKIAAEEAIKEATCILVPIEFGQMPWVGISDEGVLMVRWQRDHRGVFLSFGGDGVFTLGVKSDAGDHYSSGPKDFVVSESLPSDVIDEIKRLSTERGTIAA